MISRFKQIMRENYFGKHFSMDYRIYMIFFFESYLISIISGVTNTVLDKGIFGVVFQWTYIIFSTVLIFVIPRIRLAIQKTHLLFITFIYIPFLYFQTAGYDGTALLFAQLGLFLLAIVFSGKTRVLILILNVLNYLACIIISHLFPQTVIPHSGPNALIIDLIVALILSFTGLAILTIYISKIFEDNNNILAELSVRDALTGAYNRRYMTDFLQHEIDAAGQTENRLHVLMLDIDHFKKINDTFGHGFGDHVLITCIQAIKSVLRRGDVLVRYGGEEFAIILLSQSSLNVGEFAQRIRKKIASLHFRSGASVTVSIGVTTSQIGDTIESLINRADQCLYQAKQNGCNCVVTQVIAQSSNQK